MRLNQIQLFVDLDNLNSGARRRDMAKSEVIARKVFTKVVKEITSVRKFVCSKTNKDEIDASYPAYAFCYVYCSPSRAKPLKRIVRASNYRQQIERTASAVR